MVPTMNPGNNDASYYFVAKNNACLTQSYFRFNGKDMLMFNVRAHSSQNPSFGGASNNALNPMTNIIDGFYIVLTSDTSNNNAVALEKVLALDTWYTITAKIMNADDPENVYAEMYIDGEFMTIVPKATFMNTFQTTGAVTYRGSTTMRFNGIAYFDDFTYTEPDEIGTVYSPYTAEQFALMSAYSDKVVNVTIEAGVAATDSQKYTVAYAGNVLTISGSSAIAEGDITAVIVNGKVYTGGWTITDGKLTANYTAE